MKQSNLIVFFPFSLSSRFCLSVPLQAHLARARAKYVRGLENFERNTGKALFLAPELVDASLLPSSATEDVESDLTRRAAWGTGDEESLEWQGDVPLERRDPGIFDPSTRYKGIPNFANKRALERRVVKNPKVVYNPKHSSAAATTTTTTAAPAVKTGGVGLTDYSDGTRALSPFWFRARRRN